MSNFTWVGKIVHSSLLSNLLTQKKLRQAHAHILRKLQHLLPVGFVGLHKSSVHVATSIST